MSARNPTAADITAARERWPRAFDLTPSEKLRRSVFWAIGVGLLFFALWRTGFFDVGRLINGVGQLGFLIKLMMPPASNGWFMDFLEGIFETLAMAFLGTLLAALASIPLGILGARNVIPNWVFHFGLRRIFDGLRGIDQLIWALIFVNVVGLGPFAGIMAIFVSDTGTLAKLFSEAIENVEAKQVEGVRASGGDKAQIVRFGMIPQVLPVMLSNVLYYFESNTRSATILGIVGAGGIGLQLSDRIRVNNWDEAAFIIIMILITVAIIDYLSKLLRLRIIAAGEQPVRTAD
ncbi:MAG: phosphonate ABC transporter, permease protein PhnE [Alphaproteobacteria bacterium]|nr:phosphonate ABC transporter, permease protein PhnE [Alphaproteobacteria bacterium]